MHKGISGKRYGEIPRVDFVAFFIDKIPIHLQS